MATAHEQEVAKDIVVAWLNICAPSTSAPTTSDLLRDPARAGSLIANVYKTIVQAISETSTVATGVDATQ